MVIGSELSYQSVFYYRGVFAPYQIFLYILVGGVLAFALEISGKIEISISTTKSFISIASSFFYSFILFDKSNLPAVLL